ncbi:hypothetical protein [Micromonospora sp. 4G55]|uniref:hypothetical protein n=1 Tax=Micromonospora sp. 4G55 TaxID=2806102 RepID=UPI001A393306|nr:hypothetical protein [Micromonospora sp. 4G55]MBM0256360.1 hypothetical protein [Micromonospora sp. 4G55]
MLLIGGPRHGNDVPIDDTAQTFVDVASATTYTRRRILQAFPHALTGKTAHLFAQEVLVHETVRDQVQMQLGIGDILVSRWFREEGTEVPPDQWPGAQAAQTPPTEGPTA